MELESGCSSSGARLAEGDDMRDRKGQQALSRERIFDDLLGERKPCESSLTVLYSGFTGHWQPII